MDVPKLWSVLAVIAMGMLITCSTSCKSGKKLNSKSSGVIRVITPNDLIAHPNGTYKSIIYDSIKHIICWYI